ncbi:MAG: hypothetical protein O7D91_08855, partial [Planctomycetota bacterium]|nr:hypothetical protein [Planctomycetota bacterium]
FVRRPASTTGRSPPNHTSRALPGGTPLNALRFAGTTESQPGESICLMTPPSTAPRTGGHADIKAHWGLKSAMH